MIVRLFTLMVLGMIGYFTLKTMFASPDKPLRKPQKREFEEEGSGEKGMNASVSRDMSQDPVCHTYVEEDSALYVVHEGRKVYFCSPACRDRFLASHSSPEES